MNKYGELLAAKAAPLLPPSATALSHSLDELRAPDGKIGAQVIRHPRPPPLPPNLFPAFVFVFLFFFAPHLGFSPGEHFLRACLVALIESALHTTDIADVSFEIEMSCESGSGV